MLGHASIDQTDTDLNARRIGLQEEMRRFDGMRCNSVATAEKIEHPNVGNEEIAGQEQVTVN